MPRNILFIDDQWCQPGNQCTILAEYGSLQRLPDPFVFHFETAEDAQRPGKYMVGIVAKKIQEISDLFAVITDLTFGHQRYFGHDIIWMMKRHFPHIPVIMMSSEENVDSAKKKALELGACTYLIKKPTLKELQTALERVIQGK